MRNILRRLLQPILWRLYRWYSSEERHFRMDGLTLVLGPSVFHPAWMLTTRTFTSFALQQDIVDKKVLELGAGNGFLALSCQRAKAQVMATDINVEAIQSLQKSRDLNQLSIEIVESDLFDQIPQERSFDFIFINPPYFPREPQNDRERAYYCGHDFSYFRRLFPEMRRFTSAQVFMILTDDCDLRRIKEIAAEHHWHFSLIEEKKKLGETHLIYQINRIE